MQNAKRIQVGPLTHDIHADDSVGQFHGMPGRLVVEMLPPTQSVGLLVMPETVGANLRSDVGVVLSPQFATQREGRYVLSPKRGSLVCVAPYDGFWLEGAETGGYVSENQIRVYGHFCETQGQPEPYDWWHSVLCEIDPMSKKLSPQGDKIVFRPDDNQSVTEGGILLPDVAQRRSAMGTVVAAGPLAHDLQEGDRICYDPKATSDDRYGFDLDEDLKDLWVMSADGVMYRTAREIERMVAA